MTSVLSSIVLIALVMTGETVLDVVSYATKELVEKEHPVGIQMVGNSVVPDGIIDTTPQSSLRL